MSKIEILSCASCGASLSPTAMKCEFCDNINVVSKDSNPLKLNSILSKQYLISDALANDNFNKGLLHLNLKNYDIAQKLLDKEIENNPINADAYYYNAISITNGKRIRNLGFNDIKTIAQHLNTAIQIDDNAKYYFLSAIVNYDFFEGNGMIMPEPNYCDLLQKTKELQFDTDDLGYLQTYIYIPQNEIFNQFINK